MGRMAHFWKLVVCVVTLGFLCVAQLYTHSLATQPSVSNIPMEDLQTVCFASSARIPSPPVFPPDAQTVLVTGGAGYIGSHAALTLLERGYRVVIVDNLSRGNLGAIEVLKNLASPGQLSIIIGDLGDQQLMDRVFKSIKVDVVIHFAAIAFVGESTADPLRYWHNITSNTLGLLEVMKRANVKRLIYSSTCATYGNPEKMPITEETPTSPINPYGAAKLAAEDAIRAYAASDSGKKHGFSPTILRYFNVYGADPEGRLGEWPRPELAKHGRISTACFDAATGNRKSLKIFGTDFPTPDGSAVRDYIHVSDLVDAHVAALTAPRAAEGKAALYNVGVGKGYSVKEFVEACKTVTGADIKVEMNERRHGDYAEVFSDPTKITKELGWTAKYTDLTMALSTAWKWRLKHPNGYDNGDTWNRPDFVMGDTGTQAY